MFGGYSNGGEYKATQRVALYSVIRGWIILEVLDGFVLHFLGTPDV